MYKHGVKLLIMNMGWKFKSAYYVYDLVYSSVLADGVYVQVYYEIKMTPSSQSDKQAVLRFDGTSYSVTLNQLSLPQFYPYSYFP